ELAEGAVDLGLQGGEGGRVPSELLGPELLLVSEVGADLLKGLVRRRNLVALLGVEPNTHGGAFRRGTSLLLPTLATQARRGSPFWEGTQPLLQACQLRKLALAQVLLVRQPQPARPLQRFALLLGQGAPDLPPGCRQVVLEVLHPREALPSDPHPLPKDLPR